MMFTELPVLAYAHISSCHLGIVLFQEFIENLDLSKSLKEKSFWGWPMALLISRNCSTENLNKMHNLHFSIYFSFQICCGLYHIFVSYGRSFEFHQKFVNMCSPQYPIQYGPIPLLDLLKSDCTVFHMS